MVAVDFQHSQVGFRVFAHYDGAGFAAIVEQDENLVGTVNHMVVRQNKTIFLHNHAGPQRGLNALLLVVEQSAEIGIVHQRMLRGVGDLARVNVHH